MVDLRALGRARAVGAVHEAERLGSAVVGTEHLLLASLTDPSVRWAFRTVGVDMREVHDEVVRTTERRPLQARRGPITAEAADAVMHASGDDEALDADHPDTADVNRVLRALAQRFLSRAKQSEARVVLDGLGVLQHRARVLAVLDHNARGARTAIPGGRSAGPVTLEPGKSRRLPALSAELRPDPDAPA